MTKSKFNFSMQDIFFFLILGGLSIAFYNILLPFITDIFLTLIIVILFKRPYIYFLKKFKDKRSLAAGVTLLLVAFMVIIPLAFIIMMVSGEISENYLILEQKWPEIQKLITQKNIQEYLPTIPYVGDYLKDIKIEDYNSKIEKVIGFITGYAFKFAQNAFTNITMMLVHMFIILFLMYYMLIDGKKLLERIQYLIPLNDDDERELFTNLEKVTDAIVINTFMIGAIEGTYGGILFAILGIPSPFFWGFLMAVLSIIPLVGANSVLLPMGLFQLLIGNYTTGTLVLILGVGAVLINQNIIRPRIDGNKSGMHTAIVFLASMGGLIWMGIIGFLAGPLIAGLFITIWNQFGLKYNKNLIAYKSGDFTYF